MEQGETGEREVRTIEKEKEEQGKDENGSIKIISPRWDAAVLQGAAAVLQGTTTTGGARKKSVSSCQEDLLPPWAGA